MTTKTHTFEAGSNGHGDGALPAPAEHDAAGPASRELHSFVADIEDLVTATTPITGADLSRVKARLGEQVTAAQQALTRTGAAIADGARKGAVATDDYVRASPWRAVGIAAAAGSVIGLLLGLMLGRRG